MDSPSTTVLPDTLITPSSPIGDNELLNLETQPNKRRRKKSIVWEYFTIETVDAGCTRACCKQCKKSFAYITGTKLAGTSHLKRHITMGICPVSRMKNQQTPDTLRTDAGNKAGAKPGNVTDPPKRRYRASPGNSSISFDQNRSTHEIAKMIIMHEYPPHIIEHPAFVDFVHILQPQFNVASFNTIQGDCVAMYLKEKKNLLNVVSGIPGRVNLALDLWSSNQSLVYAVLTGNFIDSEWNLHRRVLNVVVVSSPDSDVAFNEALVACLSDWHLNNKLLTLTLDQSFSNETVNGNLRGFLSVQNPFMLNCQLIIGSCYARVIGRLAQDAVGAIRETVNKIRASVKYVKTSDTHEEKFLELKERLQVPCTKDLVIDDQTKWNTTYHMLVAAHDLKEVFACLKTFDPDYKLVPPTRDDWKQVEILCIYLKYFFDAANIVTSPAYPTASAFYHEVSKIQIELTEAAMSDEPFTSYLTKPLKERFDGYWRDCFLVLAIAVVIDPRFKMKLIEFSFSRIYGGDAGMWIKAVDDGLHELFHEYLVLMLALPDAFMDEGNDIIPKSDVLREETLRIEDLQEGIPHEGIDTEEGNHHEHSQDMSLMSIGDGLSDFEVYISEFTTSQPMRSELDQYLEEPLLPRTQDFDLLDWWKQNQERYPTLSKMASDILSIPFCTVPSDSVFDTVSKKMDTYRSSLRPVTLEALVCAKDWMQYGSLSSDPCSATVKMEF